MQSIVVRIVAALTMATMVTGAFAQTTHKTVKKTVVHKTVHHMKRPMKRRKMVKHHVRHAAMKHTKANKMMLMNCPVCHMPMSMKKTAANPVAVHLNGKTMYCCSQCKMPASVMGPMHRKK
jgi:hypothetical protein